MTRFRVAILGTSFGRTVHVRGFQRHPGFDVVAIAGADAAKSEGLARELGIARGSGDWRRLLADDPPDVVCIVTPVDLHHPMMIEAVERGCHVLCEKPTAMNRFQAAEMRAHAAAHSRVAAINHEFRFFPARRYAVKLVGEGAIGTPRRGEILGRYPIWPLPGSRGMTWLSDRRRGGGILGALGSHHTDCLRLCFGEPRTVLASVRVDQPRRGPVAGTRAAETAAGAIATADDACMLHYEFDAGATALIDLSACAPYRWERFEIHGSEATLRWDETGYRLWRLVAGSEPEELSIPADLALVRHEGEPALVAPFEALVARLHRALLGEEAMSPNFDDGVAVQSALDAARHSSAAGTRVTVEAPP